MNMMTRWDKTRWDNDSTAVTNWHVMWDKGEPKLPTLTTSQFSTSAALHSSCLTQLAGLSDSISFASTNLHCTMSHIELRDNKRQPAVAMDVDTGHQDVIPIVEDDPMAQELHDEVKPFHFLTLWMKNWMKFILKFVWFECEITTFVGWKSVGWVWLSVSNRLTILGYFSV